MKMFRKDSLIVLPAMLALLLGVVGLVAFAGDRNYPTEPAGFEVGITSRMIAAPRSTAAPNWVLGTAYARDAMVRSTAHTSRIYWNVTTNAGAATTNPDHLDADTDVTDGNITWRRIIPKPRKGIYGANNGGDNVWLGFGHAATVSNGVLLTANGTFWEDEKVQCAIYAISNGTTNRVSTQEL